MRVVVAILCLAPCIPSPVHAQLRELDVPRVELAVQADFNYLDGVGEWGGGLGARFHFNFSEHLALDSELAYRKQNITNAGGAQLLPVSIGQTTGLFGLRAGQRVRDFGFFAHARAGFLHFGTTDGASLLTRKTMPAFEAGGTLEHYRGPLVFRFDLGELIIPYGSARLSPNALVQPSQPAGRLGIRASPLGSVGIGFRF